MSGYVRMSARENNCRSPEKLIAVPLADRVLDIMINHEHCISRNMIAWDSYISYQLVRQKSRSIIHKISLHKYKRFQCIAAARVITYDTIRKIVTYID